MRSMSLFVDTSALYALLVGTETGSDAVAEVFTGALESGRVLITTSYVLVESTALLQRRFGLEAMHDLEERIVPALRVHWVRAETHRQGVALLRRLNQRHISLVDCVSFVVMRSEGIVEALALDDDFVAQGFRLVP
jgi:uncharacterized protein